MRAVVILLNVLSSVASLAMAGYGVLILMLTRMDPLRTDYVGTALGAGLLAAFLAVPTFCVARSVRLASVDRRASILLALIPFALVALGIVIVRTVPWPATPGK